MNTDGRGKLGLILDFKAFTRVGVEFNAEKDAQLVADMIQKERIHRRNNTVPPNPMPPEIEAVIATNANGKYMVWYRDRT